MAAATKTADRQWPRQRTIALPRDDTNKARYIIIGENGAFDSRSRKSVSEKIVNADRTPGPNYVARCAK